MILERPEFAVAVVGETAGGITQHAVREVQRRRGEFLHALPLGRVTAVGLRLVGRALHDFLHRVEVEPAPATGVALK